MRHPSNKYVASVLGLAVVGAVSAMVALGPASAAADNPLPPSEAAALADAARAAREQAERRLADLIIERERLAAQLGTMSGETQRLARELERAKATVRSHAVAAYVDSGSSAGFAELIVNGNLDDASARRTLLATRTSEAIEAASALQRLKEHNDPRVVELGEQLAAADDRVVQAESDVVQTRGYEADAERELSRSEEAARRAAAAAAAAASAQQPVVAPLARTAGSAADGTPVGAVPPAPLPSPSDADLPPPPPGGPSEEQWAALRNCESGGNYGAVSRSGLYRGAYQFDQRTFESVGGRGDPAAASPADQDLRAKILYSRRGSTPWPVCGRFLR